MVTTQSFTYYDEAAETCSREELLKIQEDKLFPLIQKVWQSNKFYQNKWKQAGLTDIKEIKSIEDFKKLPFTTKRELVEDQESNPPYGTNLTLPLEKYIRQHQTSGTTGRPLKWLDTEESWDWLAKCWCYVYRGAGVGPDDKLFFPFSFGPFIGFWEAFEGARKLGALAIPGGGQDSLTRLDAILSNEVDVVVCTPSYALRLAEIAEEKGIDLRRSKVRITIHAGEPGAGIPSTKQKIESAWGVKCFDHYGMTESGAMGFECQAQPGGTHLIESEYIIEVIDPSTGNPVAEGEEGELVISNLGRLGSPLFRYRTGDIVKLTYEPCSCGRTFARAQGGVIGRTDDMIIVRGVNVFPSALENIMRQYAEVKEFLIEIYKIKEMFELKILLELDESYYNVKEKVDSVCAAVVEDIRRNLNIRVMVEAVSPGSLPRFEHKARRLVKKY